MPQAASSAEPFRIVILGGGVTGWMAAAALARALPPPAHRISLVPLPADEDGDGGFGPALATLPAIAGFRQRLGLDEDRLLRDTRGTFSLGIACTGWTRPGQTYFMPFGDVGAALGPVAFHQLAGRLRSEGRPIRLTDYSLAVIAAQLGRFVRPSEDPRSPLSAYAYGLHMLRENYAIFLRRHAPDVSIAPAPFSHAELGPDGAIAALVLADGRRVAGDLFIDCSGPRAALIGETLGVRYASWSHWLPCDRVLSVLDADDAPPDPYSHVAADVAGWRRSIPLQGLRAESYVWASAYREEESGVRFEAGRRERFWRRNCIAVGGAAATFAPLQSTGLHLARSAIERLIALFPHQADEPPEAAEFDRLLGLEAENARDFLILRYKTNGRHGEPFWDACRAMAVPDSLAWKIAAYRSRGRVPLYDEEVFDKEEWVTLFEEQGVRPRRYDPLADGLSPGQIDRHVTRLREAIVKTAAGLPTHADYIRQHCAAPGRAA